MNRHSQKVILYMTLAWSKNAESQRYIQIGKHPNSDLLRLIYLEEPVWVPFVRVFAPHRRKP